MNQKPLGMRELTLSSGRWVHLHVLIRDLLREGLAQQDAAVHLRMHAHGHTQAHTNRKLNEIAMRNGTGRNC